MLKMVATLPNGRSLLVLGLSAENMRRLPGAPIKIKGEDIGLPLDVVIFTGDTEQSMARDLADLIGPNTQVKIDPRLRDA